MIRTSGENAVDIVARCFSQPQALLGAEGYHAVYGWIFDPVSQERLDEVVALVFRAPHSFTGENAVEIMCQGSTAVAQRILAVLYTQGFSPALPGEFSFRAFAGGKTDLVRAEAINELTHASCEAARHDALQRLSGVLSRKLEEIRNLITMSRGNNARLDYPEDEGPKRQTLGPLMQRSLDELSIS